MFTLTKVIARRGLLKGLLFYFKMKKNKTTEWSIPELKYPVFLRKHTSDNAIFKQIFARGEYDIRFKFEPRIIIDGGGNIGLFAVLMANRFPDALIISIEPSTSNFEQLLINTKQYPNIIPLQVGIWNKECCLKIVDENYGEWGLQVKETAPNDPGSVQAVTIGQLMKKYNLKELHIVKLDVEGAEKMIFENNYHEWLSQTRVLIIELHDRIWPGISDNFKKAIGSYLFDCRQNGEYYIYTRRM